MPPYTADARTMTQVRFGGVGGQGIVLAGRLLGTAAALFDGKHAVCTQTYGPEARGGASRADVIIADEPVDYPFVTTADVLTVFFQEAYLKFRGDVSPGGTIIVDTGLVRTREETAAVCGLPATRIAEELGNRLATNVVMLGFVIGRTAVVGRGSVESAIRATIKPRNVDLNLAALDAGIRLAEEALTS